MIKFVVFDNFSLFILKHLFIISYPQHSLVMPSTSSQQGWDGKNTGFIIFVNDSIPEVIVDTEIFEVTQGFKLAR